MLIRFRPTKSAKGLTKFHVNCKFETLTQNDSVKLMKVVKTYWKVSLRPKGSNKMNYEPWLQSTVYFYIVKYETVQEHLF